MINTIKELREFLGENYTVACWDKTSKIAFVDRVKVILPIAKKDLKNALK